MCKMVGEQDGMLKDLKLLLGMDPEDASQDDKLLWILQSARARLKVLLGGLDPPAEMEHIITEAAVIRFNRIGSEGMTINVVEGENLHFSGSDFGLWMRSMRGWMPEIRILGGEGFGFYEV